MTSAVSSPPQSWHVRVEELYTVHGQVGKVFATAAVHSSGRTALHSKLSQAAAHVSSSVLGRDCIMHVFEMRLPMYPCRGIAEKHCSRSLTILVIACNCNSDTRLSAADANVVFSYTTALTRNLVATPTNVICSACGTVTVLQCKHHQIQANATSCKECTNCETVADMDRCCQPRKQLQYYYVRFNSCFKMQFLFQDSILASRLQMGSMSHPERHTCPGQNQHFKYML